MKFSSYTVYKLCLKYIVNNWWMQLLLQYSKLYESNLLIYELNYNTFVRLFLPEISTFPVELWGKLRKV